MKVSIIIPALNEEKSIASVIKSIPKVYDKLIVVDNGSSDNTSKIAGQNGATVLYEENIGYGSACLKGIDFLSKNPPDVLVFLDGDYSDYPEEISKILNPIFKDNFDFVIGCRNKNLRESGSMTPQQIFGNKLACFLMSIIYNSKFSDLGPFRAIKWDTLNSLKMEDKTYGWTVEMQLKVLIKRIQYCEVPVRYRKRIGYSKVSGTIKGSILAGIKIIGWILKYSFKK
ncbi:MAG: UDP-glucose--dolichyl-phosphate glucosyltransferase [Flavobacteriaceae bacterium]|nr:UDP-glucose--dolichyl-phosphate glucosyltransferase [Flavobacteriaceae bacterium]|tara:strand:- start:5437 stop:6120 length:684 start_codon:yes stop_codon:yes gene_type:complete